MDRRQVFYLLLLYSIYTLLTVCCSGNSIHTDCDSSFGVSSGSCLALASGVEAAECFISYPYNRNFIRPLANILQLNKDDRGGFALQDYLGAALIYDDINFGFLNHLLVAKVWNIFSPSNALSAAANDVNSRHSVQGYLLNYLPPLYSVLSVTRVPCEARPSVQNACQLTVEVYACVPNEHLARQQRVLLDSTSTPSNITSDDEGAISDKGGTAILEIERITNIILVLVSFSMNGIWWFSSRHLQLPMQCTVSVKMNYSCGSSALIVQHLACYGISLLVKISYDTAISVVETLMVDNVVVPKTSGSVLNAVDVISFHLSAQAFAPNSRLLMQPQDDRFNLCLYGIQRLINGGAIVQYVDSSLVTVVAVQVLCYLIIFLLL